MLLPTPFIYLLATLAQLSLAQQSQLFSQLLRVPSATATFTSPNTASQPSQLHGCTSVDCFRQYMTKSFPTSGLIMSPTSTESTSTSGRMNGAGAIAIVATGTSGGNRMKPGNIVGPIVAMAGLLG
ncbi:hypothetical protein BT63DRAFT_412641 [Microthyrium microscopicum]|uniref:Uncharacterized protein n=1 Tax=Microthyrium microscopicum TaxID=703497 RepID=A0A6A6UG28_9PEZI|nr:hypothetical protein BT63DRAFT_412641 [Microthyrium microscopicum]